MTRLAIFTGLCSLGLCGLSAADEAPLKPIALPDEQKAEVISLDFRGGFTPPRQKNSPTLSVLRDGTVLIPDNYGQSQDVKSQISEEELQELLRFIIETHQFFELDAGKIQTEIKKAEKPKPDKNGKLVVSISPRVADAPTTVIKVETKDQEHEVQWYALSMSAAQHNDIAALQHLHAIEQRLQQLIKVVHAGGSEQVAKVLKLINDEVQRQHPGAPDLTAEHLVSAQLRPDGSRSYFLQWIRPGKDGNAASSRYVTVNLQLPVQGEPTFKISAKLK